VCTINSQSGCIVILMSYDYLSVPCFVTEINVFCSLSAAHKTVENYEIHQNELVAEGLGKVNSYNAAVTRSLS